MEKAFTKPYENGWDAKPASNSWVTPEIMDNYDNAIDEIDNRVIGQSEDLTQFIDDGFLPNNLTKDVVLSHTYIHYADGQIKTDASYLGNTIKYPCVPSAEVELKIETTLTNPWICITEFDASGNRTSSNGTYTKDLKYNVRSNTSQISFCLYSSNIQPSDIQKVELFVNKAKPNTELTQIVDDAIERGYLSNVHIDMNNIALNRVLGATDGTDVGSNGRCYTIDYTDVRKSKKVLLTSTSATSVNVHYYDANKVWKRSDNRWVTLPYEIEVGNDIAFLRFSFNVSNSAITQAQVDALGIELADESTPSNTELKENLTPNGYISSGLTYTNCSYVNGGYCKIGNLVVINMRVTATNPTFNVSGFPSYSGFIPVNSVALNVFDASSNSTTSQPVGMVEASGKITVVKATNNYIYFLSATYIAN